LLRDRIAQELALRVVSEDPQVTRFRTQPAGVDGDVHRVAARVVDAAIDEAVDDVVAQTENLHGVTSSLWIDALLAGADGKGRSGRSAPRGVAMAASAGTCAHGAGAREPARNAGQLDQ